MVADDKKYYIPDYMQKLLAASSKGIDVLTKTLAETLDKPVVISTPAYEPISVSFSFFDCDFFNVELMDSKEPGEDLFFCKLTADDFHVKAIGKAVIPAGRITAYLFVLLENDEEDLEEYKPAIDHAAHLYSVHIQRSMDLREEQLKYKNAFLYDLIYGNHKYNEDICAAGEMLGWNFRQPHTVLLFLLTDMDLHSYKVHFMDILSRIVNKVLANKYHNNPCTIVRQNELITIVPAAAANASEQKVEIYALTEKVFNQALDTELANKIACGVGQTYAEAAEIFCSYQEAKVSYEVGKLLGVTVPFFSDLGLERILYKHDFQDLKEFYIHILGELHRQKDAESLISTLEAFSDNDFDINKTAEAIFLHRNTLRYRLNKIENILGRNLSDSNMRMNIVAAFIIKKLHKMDKEI